MKSFLLAILLGAAPAAASTFEYAGKVCPVCLADISYREELSGTVFDTGLDLRPVGMIMSPSPLPVCPECGFVAAVSSGTPAEVGAWRALAISPGYAALKSRSAYYRLAYAEERTGGELWKAGLYYLKASWEEEQEAAKYKEDLVLALARFEAAASSETAPSPGLAMVQYLRADLLPRASRFGEARTVLASLRKEDVAAAGLAEFVKYQRILCARKDPAPRNAGDLRRRGLVRKLRDLLGGLF